MTKNSGNICSLFDFLISKIDFAIVYKSVLNIVRKFL